VALSFFFGAFSFELVSFLVFAVALFDVAFAFPSAAFFCPVLEELLSLVELVYRLSGVPSFFRGAFDSLVDLEYLLSGVTSFFRGTFVCDYFFVLVDFYFVDLDFLSFF
jgi:hypothetical protein